MTSPASGTVDDDVHRLAQVDHVPDRADQRVLARRDRVRPPHVHPLRPDRDPDLARPAARRDVSGTRKTLRRSRRDHPLSVRLAPRRGPVEEVRLADELGDERGARVLVDLGRRAQLGHPGVVHDRDPVGHGERLFLVVGDVDEGGAELLVERLELELHLLAQLEVDGAERLVQQQDRGLEHQRAGQRHPLPLAARELAPASGRRRRPGLSRTISSARRTRSAISALGVFRCSRPKATLRATVRWGKRA